MGSKWPKMAQNDSNLLKCSLMALNDLNWFKITQNYLDLLEMASLLIKFKHFGMKLAKF